MQDLLQIFIRSLETGSYYALAALGIVLIFRTSKTTNFAQGSIGTLNAFVAATLFQSWGWPYWIAAIVAIITAFITGILIDILVIRPASKVSVVSKQIITLGLIIVIIGLIPLIFGVTPMRLPKFILQTDTTELLLMGVTVSFNTIFVITISVVLMGLLYWFLKYTRWGLAVRVTASNEITSRLMGVPTKTVTMTSWAVAAILGTLAALIVAPQATVSTTFMTDVQVNAFFACTLGGFQSFFGPVLGAYIIAFSKNTTSYYFSSIWSNVLVYTLILIFLFFKPYGIVGKKIAKKV